LIDTDKQSFAVSSLYLANTLPFPLDIEPARMDDTELNQDALSTIKKLKKVRLISKYLFDRYKEDANQFNQTFITKWLNGHYMFKEEDDLFSSVVVKKHVATRNKWALRDDEKALFYTHRFVYSQNTLFDCYIYGEDTIIDSIKETLEHLVYFTFGGKQSIGLNLFKYVDLHKAKTYIGPSKVLLSKAMVVKGEVDLDQSFYKTSIIESIFDNMIGDKHYRKPIIVFDEGSVFKTEQAVIGHVVKTDVGIIDYQNALGLIL
jgi:CRISPR type III-A-associated RAMP protein Csm4